MKQPISKALAIGTTAGLADPHEKAGHEELHG
jgi:hypothetical protein